MGRHEEVQLIPDEHYLAQLQLEQELHDRLGSAGLTVLTNDGRNQNLCSLIALLQYAGIEEHALPTMAEQVRDALIERDDDIGNALREGLGLYADRQTWLVLVEHIFGQGEARPQVVILRAQPGATALLVDPLRPHDAQAFDARDVNDNAVVLVEQAEHYQVVRNDSDQRWAAALAPLQEPVWEPEVSDEALIAAYLQASSTKETTAASHAADLRSLSSWLREPGQGRPTLGELRTELAQQLAQQGTPARSNALVIAYRTAVGVQTGTGKRIASALDALVRGNTATRPQASTRT